MVVTAAGLAAIATAAPAHVDAVRRAFIDRLSGRNLATLDRIATTVMTGLTASR